MSNFVVQQISGDEPLSEEDRERARAAAMAIFAREHIAPLRAITAQAEVDRLDAAGMPEDRLPRTVRQRFDVLSEAERAAGAAIGRARVSLRIADRPAPPSAPEDENADPVG